MAGRLSSARLLRAAGCSTTSASDGIEAIDAFLDKPWTVNGLLEAVSLATGRLDIAGRRSSTQSADELNGV
jgi:hypothetical protein